MRGGPASRHWMPSPEERRAAEADERAMATDPQGSLRRRDFLRRTAYAAGLGAAAASLPLDLLLGQAAKQEARAAGLPSPANMQIDHFVVLMMENRSFDHYFGWLPGADAVQQRSYADPCPETDDRRDQADHQRLQHHGPDDLAA